MNNKGVLFEVKQLEKVIFRNLDCSFKEGSSKLKLIRPTQMQIIEYMLKNNDKDIYQKDLENVLHLRRATVSGVLKTMEKNGLILRVKNEDDTRGKKIILNSGAVNTFNMGRERLKKIENEAIKDIDENDMETFLNVLRKMKQNIEESEKENV